MDVHANTVKRTAHDGCRSQLSAAGQGRDSNRAFHALPRRRGLSQRALDRACGYIATNLGESVTLDDLAGAAAVSRFHFVRAFKLATGESPMAFLRRSRIERAKQLLRRGGQPIAEIAVSVGFYDQSHFSRIFRQIVGATPAQYARRQCEGEAAKQAA